MIAGFYLIDVHSREEAIEWAMRMPDPYGGGEGEIELRQVIEPAELTQDPATHSKADELDELLKRTKQV